MTARDSIHRHRTRLPYAVTLVALVALAALGACTSSGAAEKPTASSPPTSAIATTAAPSTTTTAPPSPTPSVDPVLANIPAAARPETEASAKAFAAFFLDSLNRASIAADPSILEGLFDSGCKTCVAMVRSVDDLKKAGNHHNGPTLRIIRVFTDSFVSEKRVVIAEVNQQAVDVVDSAGKRVDRTLAAKGAFAMTLVYGRGHWTISRLQTVAR